MGLKDLLKDTIEGTGEVASTLTETVSGLVKGGTEDVADIFGAVIELGKDGVVDVANGVKDVYVAAVKALEESGKTTEEAMGEITAKAEDAIGKITKGGGETVEEGIGAVAGAAKKGIEEAKEVVKTPFNK